jgi:hypothetical protein
MEIIFIGIIFMVALVYVLFRTEIYSLIFGIYFSGQLHTPASSVQKYRPNVDWFKYALKKAQYFGNLVAGELNVIGYEQIKDDIEDALKRNIRIKLIFGPQISIKDEDIVARYNKEIPLESVHPIFDLASKYPEYLLLYIPTDGQRQQVHSGAFDKMYCVIEESHKEMDERSLIRFDNNTRVSSMIHNNIEKLIAQGKVLPIQVSDYDRSKLRAISELKDPIKVQTNDIIFALKN